MKLNNRGYMLVEIILASVLAFGMAYFLISMTIRLKNKNDDLLVETLVSTDQAIIANQLMKYAKSEGNNFKCSDITKDGKAIKYKGIVLVIVNDYVTIDDISCNNQNGNISFNIPLNVKQLPNQDYSVKIAYNYNKEEKEEPGSGTESGYTPPTDACIGYRDASMLCLPLGRLWSNGCSNHTITYYCTYRNCVNPNNTNEIVGDKTVMYSTKVC